MIDSRGRKLLQCVTGNTAHTVHGEASHHSPFGYRWWGATVPKTIPSLPVGDQEEVAAVRAVVTSGKWISIHGTKEFAVYLDDIAEAILKIQQYCDKVQA